MNAINPAEFEYGYYSYRVLRGASFFRNARGARASHRNRDVPSGRRNYIGFRLVRNR